MGLFEKLKSTLSKTRQSFGESMNSLLSNFRTVDEDFLEELEEILLADPQNATILQANSGGASGHIIQNSHLSKNRFVAELCQQLLILCFIVRIDANSA